MTRPIPGAAVLVILAVTAFIAACYPSPELSVEEHDTVITVLTEGAQFSGFSTYAVPDTILQRPDPGPVEDELKNLILGDIHRNMQQLGYVLEADPESSPPDVVVVAGVITREEYGMFLTWPFFGGWGSYGGWGVGYPPVASGYLYTLGTVTMDMVDYANVDEDKEIVPILWSAAVSGVLEQDVQNQAQRITDGIDQAYAQSPYLKPE